MKKVIIKKGEERPVILKGTQQETGAQRFSKPVKKKKGKEDTGQSLKEIMGK